MLYAGGLGNDGTNGQGQRYKPIDNEIPDSANVQANPGQGADEPQPVRNAGTPNNNGRHQQQLNLGKSLLSTIHTSFNGCLLLLYEYTCIFLIFYAVSIGGIIALGVFGGFVFLAAIITTIVILIRR